MSAQPLTDAEFDRLAEVFQRCGGKQAMNIEMLDGFLAGAGSGSAHPGGIGGWGTDQAHSTANCCPKESGA